MKKLYAILAVAALAINANAAEFIQSENFKYTAELAEKTQDANLVKLLVKYEVENVTPEGVNLIDVQTLLVVDATKGLKWTADNEFEDYINYEDYLEGWGVTRANRLNMSIGVTANKDVVALYGTQALSVVGAHNNASQRVMPTSGTLFEAFLDASGAEDGNYEVIIPTSNKKVCSMSASDGNSYLGTEDFVLPIEKKDGKVQEATGVEAITTAKSVKAVKYYNLAGVESAQPFDGVNIMVKEYTDGSRAASKIVK